MSEYNDPIANMYVEMASHITDVFREVEQEHNHLKSQLDSLGIDAKINKIYTGNIWGKTREMRDNIERMKLALASHSS